MKRRDFLKFIGVGAIAMTLGNFETSLARRKHRRIDFHAHAILPSYINGLKKLGIDAVAEEGFPLPKWSVEDHLKFMNDAQIEISKHSIRHSTLRLFPSIYETASRRNVSNARVDEYDGGG